MNRCPIPSRSRQRAPGVTIPILVVILILALAGTCASGDFDGSPPAERTEPFVLLESTYSVRMVLKPETTDGGRVMWSGQFGLLDNVDADHAWGGTLKLVADTDGHRFGPMVRYRRWLSPSVGLDVGAGAYITGKDNFSDLAFPSPTVDVGVSFDDYAGIHVGIDAMRSHGDGTHVEPFLGARFGRWLAPASFVVVGGLLALSLSSSWE